MKHILSENKVILSFLQNQALLFVTLLNKGSLLKKMTKLAYTVKNALYL